MARRRQWILGGLAVGLAAGALLWWWTGEPPFLLVTLGAGLGIGAAVGNIPVSRLARRVKTRLNTAVAGALGLRYAEKPDEPARFETFRHYGLLPSYSRRALEDHFAGARHGCDFELYEAHLEQKRRSKKRTYYVTVFRGVLIRISFPRRVEGVTVITRDQGWFNGLAAPGRSAGGRKLERIGLVDPEFERIFEVYGDDQVLARYMLTPSFMERLLALEEALDGKRVRALFDEHSGQGELLIAAETGNFFEIGVDEPPARDPVPRPYPHRRTRPDPRTGGPAGGTRQLQRSGVGARRRAACLIRSAAVANPAGSRRSTASSTVRGPASRRLRARL